MSLTIQVHSLRLHELKGLAGLRIDRGKGLWRETHLELASFFLHHGNFHPAESAPRTVGTPRMRPGLGDLGLRGRGGGYSYVQQEGTVTFPIVEPAFQGSKAFCLWGC